MTHRTMSERSYHEATLGKIKMVNRKNRTEYGGRIERGRGERGRGEWGRGRGREKGGEQRRESAHHQKGFKVLFKSLNIHKLNYARH